MPLRLFGGMDQLEEYRRKQHERFLEARQASETCCEDVVARRESQEERDAQLARQLQEEEDRIQSIQNDPRHTEEVERTAPTTTSTRRRRVFDHAWRPRRTRRLAFYGDPFVQEDDDEDEDAHTHTPHPLFRFDIPFPRFIGHDDDEGDIVNDGLSYERMMALAEELGAVPRGVSKECINRLPTWSFKKRTANTEATKCTICLSEYDDGDELRTLPCLHAFHKECIDPWLERSRTCPICKQDIPQ